jgi:DNA modification methylase
VKDATAEDVIAGREPHAVLLGDCLQVLPTLPDGCADAIICDPPYGLDFMGRAWDHGVPGIPFWEAILRVCKPGAHLLAFGGTRTFHRLTCAVEDAGWEIRDTLMWLYGSGYPKSHDVSKAIDKAAGRVSHSVVTLKRRLAELFDASGKQRKQIDHECGFRACNYLTLPGEGKRPDPWVNVLPSQEKWQTIKRVLGCNADIAEELDAIYAEAEREVIAKGFRVRLSSTVQFCGTSDGEYDITAPATAAAKQWEGWGTALKPAWEPIIVARKPLEGTVAQNVLKHGTGALNIGACRVGTESTIRNQNEGPTWSGKFQGGKRLNGSDAGRWPANVILSDDTEVLEMFPERKVCAHGPGVKAKGMFGVTAGAVAGYDDSGSAARFFYVAKADKTDRGHGNTHNTVKPTALMTWLCRLACPAGGLVLDPFAGSGSTGVACRMEGRRFIGIEESAEYVEIARRRLAACNPVADLADRTAAREPAAQPDLFAALEDTL